MGSRGMSFLAGFRPIKLFDACMMAVGILCMSATVADVAPGYQARIIKPGETISLLCIELYGHYAPSMGAALQKANPTLTDINKITPGQKILFKDPVQAPVKAHPTPGVSTPGNPPEESSVFEKQLTITQGVVTYLEGEATIVDTHGKKASLKVNALVYPGDIIQTSKSGRVEIIINRETVVRIRENTKTSLVAFRTNGIDKGATRVGFSSGSVWTKMKKFADRVTRFQLELPTAIAGVHGTVYNATINRDSSSAVSVYEGEVAVQNAPETYESGQVLEVAAPAEVAGPHEVSLDEWVYIIKAMQTIAIDKHGVAKNPETFTKNENDSWVAFNEERDRQVSAIIDGKE